LLRECFRPRFKYSSAGLSAAAVYRLFIKDFHFLLEQTSEPARLAKMIQRLIYEQRGLEVRLQCPRHDVPMVMLGHAGARLVKPKEKIKMSTLHVVGNGGFIMVAYGLWRCTWPGCFLVAAIDESATMPVH
jgi:hypothetical protein